VSSPAFILASLQNQLRLGLISIPEAREQRYRVLTGLQPDTRHQPQPVPEKRSLVFGDSEYSATQPVSQWDKNVVFPKDERPLYTEYGADLNEYGDGIVPGEKDGSYDDLDQADYRYCIRDRVEYAIEKRKQAEGDLTHVIGANYSAGAEGSKEWLDEQLAQMRIDYNRIKLQARRFWWAKRRALPKSFRNIHDDPQLQWLTRRAELMRIRFNVRRHLEALGRRDVSSYRVTLANAPAWDRKLRNVAAERRIRNTLYGQEFTGREYIHPTGLITTNPKRRAA